MTSTRSTLSLCSKGNLRDNYVTDTGRADGCANTNIGPGRSTEEIDVGTSLPPLPMSRIDGCPECVENAETPSSAYATDDGYLCNYVCQDCGHAWSTAWKD